MISRGKDDYLIICTDNNIVCHLWMIAFLTDCCLIMPEEGSYLELILKGCEWSELLWVNIVWLNAGGWAEWVLNKYDYKSKELMCLMAIGEFVIKNKLY